VSGRVLEANEQTLHDVLRDHPGKRLRPAIPGGAKSFGKRHRPDPSGGNFKALFEAIEREQENRGTL
jgi:hypothetical protein